MYLSLSATSFRVRHHARPRIAQLLTPFYPPPHFPPTAFLLLCKTQLKFFIFYYYKKISSINACRLDFFRNSPLKLAKFFNRILFLTIAITLKRTPWRQINRYSRKICFEWLITSLISPDYDIVDGLYLYWAIITTHESMWYLWVVVINVTVNRTFQSIVCNCSCVSGSCSKVLIQCFIGDYRSFYWVSKTH